MALLLGNSPNQVPTNGDLGTAAFINAENLPVSGPQAAALELKAPITSPVFLGTVRLPNVTTTQKNAITPVAAGMLVYDTTLAKMCVFTTAWQTVTSA